MKYRERRLSELKTRQKVEGPLRWEAYGRMQNLFARGLAFERTMVALLRADAALPQARVESFSFKSRDLSLLKGGPRKAQMTSDAREALAYYGETLNIRRPELKYLGPEVQVQRVRLVYEGGELVPKNPQILAPAMRAAEETVKGVEVLVQ